MTAKKRKLPDWAIGGDDEDDGTAMDGNAAISTEGTNDQSMNKEAPKGEESHDDDEEEDYLDMKLTDSLAQSSSLISKREKALLQRQAGGKNPISSDTTLNIDPVAATSQPASKAMKMMQRMGYVTGQALGVDGKGLVEPLAAVEPAARSGLGLEAQRKQEIRERLQQAAHQVQEEQSQYRDSVREEIDEARTERLVHAAQKVCETLDLSDAEEQALTTGTSPNVVAGPLRPQSVNVLWRSLVLARQEKDRQRALRQQMLDAPTSFSKREYNEDYTDATNAVDRLARGTIYEADSEDEEDEELEEFDSLSSVDRLQRIISYMRDRYFYCFWCGCKYTDEQDLEACPGLTEADHE